MGKPTGFVEVGRLMAPKRPVPERLRDYGEVETDLDPATLREQASRCMDCGVPFCHKGCPLGNHIPDWNDLVYGGRLREASARLHATNNFPEFTGKTCPAPCEEACVLSINDDAVTIRQLEKHIVEQAFRAGWIDPIVASQRTGYRVAIVGSGPAGLAAAQQLARAGHDVTVYERDDRVGGLLRYGIPDFKLDKADIDRRVRQMTAEGVEFRTGVEVGRDVTAEQLEGEYDAVCLAIGAQRPRPMPVPGHQLEGVHFALDYLKQSNRLVAGDELPDAITAAGKRVVVLGGGDTGADCIGTALRQGAKSVQHFHYKPAPPSARTEEMPWPWWPMILRDSSSHEEGGVRDWGMVTKAFEGDDGRVRRMRCVRVEWAPGPHGRTSMRELPGTEHELEVDLVLIAVGFVGVEPSPLYAQLGVDLSDTGTVASDGSFGTDAPGVFSCGDARRGPSLVVWAIWEGREVARRIDLFLRGDSDLPTAPDPNPL